MLAAHGEGVSPQGKENFLGRWIADISQEKNPESKLKLAPDVL